MQRLVISNKSYILQCVKFMCNLSKFNDTRHVYFSVYYHTKLKHFDEDENDPANEGKYSNYSRNQEDAADQADSFI